MSARVQPLTVLVIVFAAWACLFILRTSLVSIDGARYFVLFDDAMISMRYAWNLSHGNGLVWNPGEHVEGYTNLLMTLLMAPSTALLPTRLAALPIQVAGLVLIFVSAFLTAAIARYVLAEDLNFTRSRLVTWMYCGTLCCYPLAYFALMGMETGLLTALFLGALLQTLRLARRHASRGALLALGALWGLAYLARPDSMIFTALMLLFLLFAKWRTSERWRVVLGTGVCAGCVPVLAVAGQSVFRLATYGQLAPNTYQLKVAGTPLSTRIADGLGFLQPFFIDAGLLFLLALFGLIFSRNREKLLLATLVAAAVLYQLWAGGDPWPLWRLLAPVLPLVVCLAVEGARLTAAFVMRHSRVLGPIFCTERRLVRVLLGLGILMLNAPFLGQIAGLEPPYQVAANKTNVNTAVALAAVTRPTAHLGVVWAGSVIFLSERNGVDFLGKSDAHIALLPPDLSGAISWAGMTSVPGHNKYDLHYSIDQLEPTYVETFQWGNQDLSDSAESNYRQVLYRGVSLWLRRGSKDVIWDRLTPQT